MDIDKELNDFFSDPLLDVSDKELTLFNLPADMKRVMEGRRIQPDHYAQRKQCEDFLLYKPLFEQVQRELKEGKRTLIRTSKSANLEAGQYYVVDGMLVYLHSVFDRRRARNGMADGRTRCIYENGTESDILLETLRRNVLQNGYGVAELQENIDNAFVNQTLNEGDRSAGYVYILKSLSSDPEIASVQDLYKIGFTTDSVEERTKNAVKEPTYLMAPVQIVETFEIVNMNSHIFETILHQVFSAVQFQVKVYDDEGNLHVPSEWYVVPLEIINLVVQKIVEGSITQYTYNPALQCLEKRIARNNTVFNTEGLKVLTLNIKEGFFNEIMSGEKTSEFRELKQTTLNKYTYLDPVDGKRYLRPYDVIRFYVGYHKNRDSALVEVKGVSCVGGVVEYQLGRVLEHVKQD
ncbi:MAG: GIY-YIG nuclease family protein [Bacteroidales bacterium]|nr:GIY-YIG nuclease family protein [Bacteroidales bacterium]